MNNKYPELDVDILIVRNDKILLGLLSDKWLYKGQQVYGVPGKQILLGESIGKTVRRNIKEELDCEVHSYKVISVNANYYNGHFVGIGILVEIIGEPKLLKPDDWIKWEWFKKDNLPQNLFPPAKNLIESYLDNKFCVCE